MVVDHLKWPAASSFLGKLILLAFIESLCAMPCAKHSKGPYIFLLIFPGARWGHSAFYWGAKAAKHRVRSLLARWGWDSNPVLLLTDRQLYLPPARVQDHPLPRPPSGDRLQELFWPTRVWKGRRPECHCGLLLSFSGWWPLSQNSLVGPSGSLRQHPPRASQPLASVFPKSFANQDGPFTGVRNHLEC